MSVKYASDGPWRREPDRATWSDPATGYLCLIERNSALGHLCGYVAVPVGHPCFAVPRGALRFDVHGGITWAGQHPLDKADGWLIGFDCAHARDWCPCVPSRLQASFRSHRVYRGWAFVKAEVENLARQLKDRERDADRPDETARRPDGSAG